MKLCTIFLLAPLAGFFVACQSLTGNRLVVLSDKGSSMPGYSSFLTLLKERGYDVEVKKSGDRGLNFVEYGERVYDHAVIFSSKPKSKAKELKEAEVIEFVKKGGNVMLAGSSEMSESYKRLAAQFGATFDEPDSAVVDPFNHNLVEGIGDWEQVLSNNFAPQGSFLSQETRDGPPIIFKGIGHTITSSALVTSVVQPSATAYSSLTSSFGTPGAYGSEMSLVSCHQSLNNARFTLLGSTDLFSDKFFDLSVHESGNSTNHPKSGNQGLIRDLVKWTFHETGVLQVTGKKHTKVGSEETPDNYRIKDEIVYSLNVTEYQEGKWVAYQAKDIQLEIIMLDPYIRADLPFLGVATNLEDGREVGQYQITLTLPDVYGVFTFKVNYRRDGFTSLVEADPVPIHPFRHNEFPRFITAAYPYYASSFSMSAGFLIFSVIWLYNTDKGALAKNKSV